MAITDVEKQIKKRIARFCFDRSITQTEIAKSLGVYKQTVNTWFNIESDTMPSLMVIHYLVIEHGMNADWLFSERAPFLRGSEEYSSEAELQDAYDRNKQKIINLSHANNKYRTLLVDAEEKNTAYEAKIKKLEESASKNCDTCVLAEQNKTLLETNKALAETNKMLLENKTFTGKKSAKTR